MKATELRIKSAEKAIKVEQSLISPGSAIWKPLFKLFQCGSLQ